MNIRESLLKCPPVVLSNSTIDEIATTFLGLPAVLGSIVTVRQNVYVWTQNQWTVPEPFWLTDLVRIFMSKCSFPVGQNATSPVDTPQWRINAVVETIRAYTRIDVGNRDLPIWVGPGTSPVSERFSVSILDAIVDLEATAASGGKWVTRPRTRDWFDPVVLPVTLKDLESAPDPTRFQRCLSDWGSGDPEWSELLLRMTAYLLMPYRDLQRGFLMVGKRRAGKGVWSRFLAKTVGPANFFQTDMEKMAYTHGLEGADIARILMINEVGESEAGVPAQVRRKANEIIGRDGTRINPKGVRTYTATLPGALVMVGNDLPDIEDPSDSFWSKMVIVPYKVSFLDHEDFELEDRLWDERASIYRWVLEAGVRLLVDRKFPKVKASQATRETLRRINSPIDSFFEDRCDLHPQKTVSKDSLFSAYQDWCDFYDLNPMTRHVFFRKLNGSTLPIEIRKLGPKGAQVPTVVGVGLNPLKDRQE